MSDARNDFSDLKREIVESRNQAIKTDNQVKNLSLDVKGFEKRFDALERRTRISGLGVNLIVAVTIVVAAYLVYSVRLASVTGEALKKIAEAQTSKDIADKASDELKNRLAGFEGEKQRREKSVTVASKINDHLDNKREKEAVDLLETLDVSSLTPLEQKLLDRRVGDLRARFAESAYKSGKSLAGQNRHNDSLPDLKRVLTLDPEGRYVNPARYLIAVALYNLKRYDQAEPVFREILKKDPDKGVLEEVRYLLAVTVANQGKKDEAKTMFGEVIQRGGRYSSNAKEQLKTLESSGETQDAQRTQGGSGGSKPTPATSPTPTSTTAQ